VDDEGPEKTKTSNTIAAVGAFVRISRLKHFQNRDEGKSILSLKVSIVWWRKP
jgi:hypothetical protein